MTEAATPEYTEPDQQEPIDVTESSAVALRGGRDNTLTEAWTPSPLALLSDEDFDRRIELLQVEQNRIAKIKRACLKDEVHYGTIPGTPRPSLYQPGAEFFNRMTDLRPDYEVQREVMDLGEDRPPMIRYQVLCRLVHRVTGEEFCQGWGSSSTWERKHRYRFSGRVCPSCGQETIMRSKYPDRETQDIGWYCNKNRGGCGGNFRSDDQAVAGQDLGQVENPDPHDLDNTVLQYACKRAYVKATRTGHNLSELFTQDIEDDPQAAADQAAAQKKQQGKGTQSKPTTPDTVMLDDKAQFRVREKAEERAKELGDESINGAAILTDIVKGKDLAAVAQNRLPDLLKAISNWEPGRPS